jgi:hypothetical protein
MAGVGEVSILTAAIMDSGTHLSLKAVALEADAQARVQAAVVR